MTILRLAILCGALSLLTGCATMSGSGPERIAIDSDPAGADVSVTCDNMGVVATAVTPSAVLVPRTADDCIVTISKNGYVSHDVALESGLNPRFWGNLPWMAGVPIGLVAVVFGGASGDGVAVLALGAVGATGMIVDSVTDAKRDHDPKEIRVTLAPSPPP
jgi:hypothetical protein